MSSQIKGLSQFIADLRTSSSQEAERARVQAELASVRKKLASVKSGSGSKSKNGYEHRKIVSKLLYIYILGYDVDIGSEEVSALLQMPKFAEKQVGYLALGILLHAHRDLKSQVEPIVIEDLRSTKEVLTSLALNYVSTWDVHQHASDNLVDLVYQLMVSPTSSTAVVKKAALTFLNFYRQDPQRFSAEPEWPERVERICAILAGPHLGVATSLVSLLTEIARRNPENFDHQSFSVATRKLEEVFDGDGTEANEYRYYQIFAPWLVAKLCKLLEVMYSPQFPEQVTMSCRKIVSSILSFCVDGIDEPLQGQSNENSGTQQRNACNVMLFDAAMLGNTIGVYDSDWSLAKAVLYTMKELLQAKDTNSRYFALQIVQNFNYKPLNTPSATVLAETTEIMKNITDLVLHLVKDRDISVRRQALDALFPLVNQSNVESVAAELLDLLVASDLLIRPLMVARLAVLIERFATSHEWYFDTCISLLEIGGSYAGNEVWERLVQVVVNNEALQAYAVKRVYDTLSNLENSSPHTAVANPAAHSDAIIRLGAFILGEFGEKYAGDPMDLFMILQDQIGSIMWQSKVILLSAYMKFAVKFPNLRPIVAEAISMYCESPNLETQQRANEYIRLLQPANTTLLSSLLVPMPPFGEAMSSQLFQQMGHQQKPLVPTPTARRILSADTTGSESTAQLPPSVTGLGEPMTTQSTGASSSRPTYLSSNWEFGFKRMLTHSEAVLFQDALLQIGCRYDFRQDKGSIVLYLKNISSFEISSLTVQIKNPMSDAILSLDVPDSISGASLGPGKGVEQVIHCEARQPFALTPTCRLTYLAGSFFETNFKLPIVLERFMSPSAVTMEQFSQRWDQVGAENEFTKQFRNYSATRAAKSIDNDLEVAEGMQYGIVKGSPGSSICGAGIIYTSNGGMYGSLIVLQPDAERNTYRITVRATRKKLAAVVLANNFAQAYQL